MTRSKTDWPTYNFIPEGQKVMCSMCNSHWAVVIFVPTQSNLCPFCKFQNDMAIYKRGEEK